MCKEALFKKSNFFTESLPRWIVQLVGRFQWGLVGTQTFFFFKMLTTTNLYFKFGFCKKEKKRKVKEKSLEEIIFWERIFISCSSKHIPCFIQVISFYCILLSFNHPKNRIYLNWEFPLSYLSLVALQSALKQRRKESCLWSVCSHTRAHTHTHSENLDCVLSSLCISSCATFFFCSSNGGINVSWNRRV